MVNIFFCLLGFLTINLVAAPPSRRMSKKFSLDNEALIEVEKFLKSVQETLHKKVPDHVHIGHDLEDTNGENAVASEEEKPSKLFFMMVMGNKPEDTVCNNEDINEKYTIESYNTDLSCKCRFCIRNMIDKNYNERCFPEDCEILSDGSGTDDDGDDEDQDPINDALDILRNTASSMAGINETETGDFFQCETQLCDRPDMDEINKLRCRGLECYFKYM